MIDNFFDGLDVFYHCAKFGEDRTTLAGCMFENMAFVTTGYVFLPVTLRGRNAVREREIYLSNYRVMVYGSILMQFSPFSEVIALSDGLDSSHIRC